MDARSTDERRHGRANVTWATCDDGGVADNASETGTGQDNGTTGEATSEETPRRPRRTSGGMRDMLLSMIVLAVVVLVLAGITRGCSFSPGGPSTNSSLLPTVDVSAELQSAARQVTFPLHEMRLPSGWRPNSASVDQLGPNGRDHAVRIGWISPAGHYLQVSQSDASAEDLARSAAGLGDQDAVTPTGTETTDGTKWTVYPSVRDESSWVTDLGTERLFITGNGTTNEFDTMAGATLNGQRVSRTGS